MRASKKLIVGWILSGLIAAFLIFASASGKFTDWEGKEEMFDRLGWSVDAMYLVGVVEVAVALLFLIPRSAFYGTILLSAYLGGATSTHARIGDPFFMPIIIGVLAWTALALRNPRVFNAALGNHKLNIEYGQ